LEGVGFAKLLCVRRSCRLLVLKMSLLRLELPLWLSLLFFYIETTNDDEQVSQVERQAVTQSNLFQRLKNGVRRKGTEQRRAHETTAKLEVAPPSKYAIHEHAALD
jgi:hypothetical protein